MDSKISSLFAELILCFNGLVYMELKGNFTIYFFVDKTPNANEQLNLSWGNSLLLKIDCSLTVTKIKLQKPSYSDS